MNDVVLLEWTFSPPDYLDEPIEIVRDDYSLTIAEGKAEAKIEPSHFDAHPTMRQELHNELHYRFRAMELLKHKVFELSSSTMVRVHPDGRKDFFVKLESATLRITAGALDFQVLDPNGNIVVDTKQERIENSKQLAGLFSSYSDDEIVRTMFGSFNAAMRDPNNELVHLYEIRDALHTRFGRDKAVKLRLGISNDEYRRFGEICNDLPLKQGRHRGKKIGELRDATHEELTEARNIARTMIEAYLQFLESNPVSSSLIRNS